MTNSRAKGVRNEREARELYSKAGYVVASTSDGGRWGDTDLFNLFDFIALKPSRRPIFAQVKTNSTQGELQRYFDECREILPPIHTCSHFLVKYDREGWRLWEMEGNHHIEMVDERNHDCNMGERVTEYLEL